MNRTHLSHDIRQLDQSLTLQQDTLRERRAQSVAALRQVSPLWMAGAGVLLGVLTRYHGVQGVYTIGSIGLRSQRLFRTLAQQVVSRTAV